MHKRFFNLLLLLIPLTASSQVLPDFSAIPLDSAVNFNQTANDAALAAANYLFSFPQVKTKTLEWVEAKQYLVKWFMGTPDVDFELGKPVKKAVGKNEDLLLLYTVCICKFALENPVMAKQSGPLQTGAVHLMLGYLRKRKNGLPITPELKKMIDADGKGRLQEYLQLK